MGLLGQTPVWMAVVGFVALFLGCGFLGAPLLAWTAGVFAALFVFQAPPIFWIVAAVPLAIFNLPPLRQMVVSFPILKVLKALNFLPAISETERIALEAGATWVDGELFSGRPNFAKINREPYRKVSAEEQAFIDGPVDKVCRMVNDWEVFKMADLPPEVWSYLKKERFFGMIVPKEYGGLGFSAIGHSEVIAKLSTRCIPLGITVMVPNSLGPAELINHYGTKQQKDYYLPRLARGEEIPCFALTEPGAGSDAGSLTSAAEVFKGDDGKLYLKLNWDKRYITLAAVSTLIGLAVRLKDPNNLLGKGPDAGITCVLVPANTKGVVLGKRHNPMGIPFFNCPTKGVDVVVPLDQIIGGKEGAGHGWQMLMESLAAGRSISLPAQGTALTKAVARIASGHGLIRRQFGIPIGTFEGVEEKLARITGLAYMLEGARIFTCGAVDSGIKPAVVSAIAKFAATECGRIAINDGMDVLGGSGVSRGPKNMLAHAYMANPISITVEGANILTRTMIIFGQGAIRCHPYAYAELKSIMAGDVKGFDRAFWGHIGFIVRNMCRALLLSSTRGHLAMTPGGHTRKYYRKLAWASATFAILADVAMGVYGGKLKIKEKLTGRFADVLIWMYYATATLRRFEAEGRPSMHKDVLQWTMQYCFSRMQEAFEGLFENFEVPGLTWAFRGPLAWWCRLNRFSSAPSDALGHRIVAAMMKPGEYRESIGSGIFMSKDASDPASVYERAFQLVYESEGILKKISQAIREKKLPKDRPNRLIAQAEKAGVITSKEAATLNEAEAARNEAIRVDAFDVRHFQSGLMENSVVNG